MDFQFLSFFLSGDEILLCKRQTGPSSVAENQESGDDSTMAKYPRVDIKFVSMVKMSGTTTDILSCFSVRGVVKGNKKAFVS